MQSERFPKQKYLRQLRVMTADFRSWRDRYRMAADDHPDDWLGSKFVARATVLDLVQELMSDALLELETFPRVS